MKDSIAATGRRHFIARDFRLPTFLAGLLATGLTASAQIEIALVTIGDSNNPADLSSVELGPIGSVGYEFQIGKYEVTNAQYAAFLNAVASVEDTHALYKTEMGLISQRGGIAQSGSQGNFSYAVLPNMGNKPVQHVTFWDAARFTNWLTNQQPTGLQDIGTTETGVYELLGVKNPPSDLIVRNLVAIQNGAWALPTDQEWHKAAYYDPSPSGPSDDWWLYATRSDNQPAKATANSTGEMANPGNNRANYDFGASWNGVVGNLTTVGSSDLSSTADILESASYYGTFDQNGNVFEWVDVIVGTTHRGQRGGGYSSLPSSLRATVRGSSNATFYTSVGGFRVAYYAPVPEPGTWLTAGFLTIIGIVTLRRHSSRTK